MPPSTLYPVASEFPVERPRMSLRWVGGCGRTPTRTSPVGALLQFTETRLRSFRALLILGVTASLDDAAWNESYKNA